MYRFLGLVLMVTLIAACQPQTNIQTGPQTLKTRLPTMSKTPQDQASVEKATDSSGNEVDWQQVVQEPTKDITTESAPVTMTALDADEIGEPPAPVPLTEAVSEPVIESGTELVAESNKDDTTLTDDNTLQIASLSVAGAETAAESEAITTLEDALTEIEVAAVPMDEEASQTQIVAIEEPKTPDPIHPKTIVGKSIDGLGASLGLPDFERSDADVMIWQYRLAACVTDFYLYLNGDDYVVTGWAWRPPFVGQSMDEERCEQQIGNLLDANA